MGKGNTSLTLGIIGLCLEFISLFVFGWLSVIGLVLGIIGVCLSSDSMGKKIPSIVAIPTGVILAIFWIIALASIR